MKVVINYARKESYGAVFPAGNPLVLLDPPSFKPKPRGSATLTVDEAKTILKTTRRYGDRPHIRFIPWLLAYSGARVGEVSVLNKEDFTQLGDLWFYRLVDKGEGSAKTDASIRTIPVHPALIEEGLLAFVNNSDTGRWFLKRSPALLRKWVRKDVGITRAEVGPNHGWRHLFTDFACIFVDGDAAHRALVGRSDSGSMALYGNSEAMLPSNCISQTCAVPSCSRC